MTESQIYDAMELLARLWAERNGFCNPEITITKKTKEAS